MAGRTSKALSSRMMVKQLNFAPRQTWVPVTATTPSYLILTDFTFLNLSLFLFNGVSKSSQCRSVEELNAEKRVMFSLFGENLANRNC